VTLPEEIDANAREGRALIRRVVEHLVRERGVKQIIDVGSGLPTGENVHEIAHAIDPSVRVVYIDSDAVVCLRGQALLSKIQGPAGLSQPDTVLMAEHDLLDPESIFNDGAIRALIDFDQPVGVLMMFLLHLIADDAKPHEVVAAYRSALSPGSFLAISHAAADADAGFTLRNREEIAAFFGDFVLEPPGLVNSWPYAELPADLDAALGGAGFSGVARKP
jgi:hypothetical protein